MQPKRGPANLSMLALGTIRDMSVIPPKTADVAPKAIGIAMGLVARAVPTNGAIPMPERPANVASNATFVVSEAVSSRKCRYSRGAREIKTGINGELINRPVVMLGGKEVAQRLCSGRER